MLHDIKIETSEDGACKRIYIDGVEQMGVTACDIRLRPDEVPTVNLQYVFSSIEAALHSTGISANKTFTDGVLDQGMENLELSVRAYNSLRRGIWNTWCDADHNRTIGDVLIAYRTGHLKQYENMGIKTYKEVIDRLKQFGLLTEDEE